MDLKKVKIIKVCVYVLLIIVIITILSVKLSKSKTIITAQTTLIDVFETKELDVAKFEYGGIAYYFNGKENQYFDEKTEKKADVKIKYKALVTAKVDLEEVEKSKRVDTGLKKIYLKVPKINYVVSILSDSKDDSKNENEKNFETMGTVKEGYSLSSMRIACKTDVTYEINENEKLNDYVLKMAKMSVEGFMFPKLEGAQYEIVWE